MVAIGFAGLLGPQVLRERRAIKVILASPARQAQQVRSAQQARQAPKDLLAPPARRGLLEILLNIRVRPPRLAASSNVRCWKYRTVRPF